MKVEDALYEIEAMEKCSKQLEAIANIMFNCEELNQKIKDKANIDEKPFFIISGAKRVIDHEVERIRTIMNAVEFDI